MNEAIIIIGWVIVMFRGAYTLGYRTAKFQAGETYKPRTFTQKASYIDHVYFTWRTFYPVSSFIAVWYSYSIAIYFIVKYTGFLTLVKAVVRN